MAGFYGAIERYRIINSKGKRESNRQFAARLGVDGNTIKYWRMGGVPHPETIAKICQNLDLPSSEYDRLNRIAQGLPDPSFKEWLVPLTAKMPRPPGEGEAPVADQVYSARFFFWIELADISEDYQPGIPAEDFAALLGSSLEEIESIIEDTLEPERAKEFLDRVEKLNSSKKSKGPPISTDRLSKLVATLDEATGELLKNSLSSKEIKKMVDAERAKKPPPKPERVKSEFAEIPKWNVKLAAGGGYVADIEEIEERYAFRREWLHKKTSSKDNLVMHDITGDSMEPVFSDGDVCLVDRGERQIKSGSYYALRLGDTVHIKKLQRVKGKIKIISLNKSYKPIVIDPKEDTNNFEVLGKVLWVGKEL